MRDEYGSTSEDTSAWAGLHYWAARDKGDEYLTWPSGTGHIAQRVSRQHTVSHFLDY